MRTGTPHLSRDVPDRRTGTVDKCLREAGNAWSQCKLRNRLRSVTLATQRSASSHAPTHWKHLSDVLVQHVQPSGARGTRRRVCCCRQVLANGSRSSSTRTPEAFVAV